MTLSRDFFQYLIRQISISTMSINVTAHTSSSSQDLQLLIRQGLSDQEIEFSLMDRYNDLFLVNNLMTEIRKLRNARKTTNGLLFMLTGGFLMLLGFAGSFAATAIGISLSVFLYGFTTAGLIIAFAGLIKIFT